MLEQLDHPTKDELSAFSLGQLPNEEAASVEDHISHCEPCCETLLSLESQDTFLGLLREAKRTQEDETVGLDELGDRPSSIADVPAQLAEHPRYEILGLIGKGGMGDVFKARHRRMERTVALKVINRELVRKPEAVERFHREAKTAASLSHPNIVAAHDADHVGDAHFLVMEFIDGVNLDEVVRERGPLPVAEACDYIRQAAAGLQHAHEQGMVHRDIKPHNLMLTASGEVKILDFGLASFASEMAVEGAHDQTLQDVVAADHAPKQMTQAGVMMGTPDYIAPEQAQDAHAADIRSDIYSLGCTFYALLVGHAPFGSGSALDKIKAHREQAPPPLSNLRHDVPAGVEAIVLTMLAKDPAQRFQTPADVVAALGEYQRVASERTPGTALQPNRARRRRGVLTAIAASLAAMFLAATVFYIQTDRGVVRVEVADESLQVKLDGKTIEMKDGETPISIRAGEQKLLVRRGDFEFETDTFQLRRGNKVALKVELLDGNVVVLKDGERFGAKTLPEIAAPRVGPATKETLKLVRRFQGHSATVFEVAFTPDGKRAISVSDDCTACFWDLETGKRLLQSKQSGCQMRGIAISPDGRYAVTTGLAVVLWDLSGPKFLRTLVESTAGQVTYTAAFSVDGRHLAAGSPHNGRLRVWETATGREVYETTGATARYSPDGRLLAARRGNTVALLEAESGKLVRSLGGRELPYFLFSPDGRLLASRTQDGSLVLYEVQTGKPLHTWMYAGRPAASAFLADGTRLLIKSHSPENMLAVMDVKTGRELVRMKGHSASVSTAKVLPGERCVLSSASDGTLRVWDLQDGRELARLDMDGHVIEQVALSPDGRYVLSAGGSTFQPKGQARQTGAYDVYLWQLPESMWPKPAKNPPVVVTLKKGGQYLVDGRPVDDTAELMNHLKSILEANSGRDVVVDSAKELGIEPVKQLVARIRQVGGKKVRWPDWVPPEFAGEPMPSEGAPTSQIRLAREYAGHGARVHEVRIAPDGKFAVSGGEMGSVSVWELASGTERKPFNGHAAPVYSLDIARDNRTVATGDRDGNLWLWDAATGEPIRRLEGHKGAVSSVSFAPDGRRLASGGGDQRVRIWDCSSGKVIRSLDEPRGQVLAVVYSPDGARIAAGGQDRTLRVWHAETGELHHEIALADKLLRLAWSPDRPTIACSLGWNLTRSVHLLNLNEQRVEQRLPLEAGCWGLTYTSDGRFVISTSTDERLTVWDPKTGQRVASVSGPTIGHSSLAPDGRTLLTGGSATPQLRLWQLPESVWPHNPPVLRNSTNTSP